MVKKVVLGLEIPRILYEPVLLIPYWLELSHMFTPSLLRNRISSSGIMCPAETGEEQKLSFK